VPLLVAEPTTRRLQALAGRDPLRAADALQLAAAFIAAERRPPSLEVITLDERLADAARKEGFALVDLTAG
jgi:predicted nucleic acid-binding protein